MTAGPTASGRAVALQLARGGDRVQFVGRTAERGVQALASLRELRSGAEHAPSAQSTRTSG